MVAIVKSLIVAAAIAHNVDAASMLQVAGCESSYDRYARNGQNIGLFQLRINGGKGDEFLARGYTNLWDPAQQSNFTAEMWQENQQAAWSCWRLLRLGGSSFVRN